MDQGKEKGRRYETPMHDVRQHSQACLMFIASRDGVALHFSGDY